MQSNQKPVILTVIIATLILLVVGYIGTVTLVNSIPTASEVANEIDIPTPVVNVPTADEIASLITVPTLRNDNLDDLLEGIYPDEVEELEEDCQEDLSDEFMDDLIDDLQDLLEDELGIEVKNLSVRDWNYDNDYDFDVDNLGLDDEDDRAGSIYTVLRVRYHETFGDTNWHHAKVEARSTCSDWDSDDEEFDELTSEYVLI